MEPQTNSGPGVKYAILGIVALVMSAVLGAFFGISLFAARSGTQAQGLQAAPVMNVPTNPSLVVEEVHSLPGIITDIKGSSFTFHTQTRTTDDPLADRTVIVSRDTKITKLTLKDQKTLAAEMAEFAKKTAATDSKARITLPAEPFLRTPADVSDIAIGDIVVVSSLQNISTSKVVPASEVEFHGPLVRPKN